MKTSYVAVLGLTLTVLLLASSTLLGDTSVTVRVGWQVAPYQSLSVEGSSAEGRSVSSTYIVPRPTATDLQRGFIERPNAVRLVARSNMPWVIHVRAEDVNMGTSFDQLYVKPITDLQVRAGDNAFVTVSQRDQLVARGLVGEFEIPLDYRVLFDANEYRDGDYRVTLIYTIAAE